MTPRLRIAVVSRAVMPLHGFGGLERSVHDLVRHLAMRGVAVTLIVPPSIAVGRRRPDDPFASPHIQVRHVPYLTFPGANRRGTTILDRSTAYLLYGFRAGRLAVSLARAGEIDIIHGFGASVLGAALSNRRVPLLLNPQGLEEFGATATLPRLKHAGYAPLRWAVRRAAVAAECILATDVSLEPVVARHLKPRPGQVRTIPNGIDLAAASALAGSADGAIMRQRQGIPPGETVLLSVGRLEFNKGFDVLAAALARAATADSVLAATGWRWVIVGTGPFRQALERTVVTHGLDGHVIFAGRIAEQDLHAWYEAASIFVHPTRYEGSSLVTLEAMAHRRAVIATRAGGLPDKVSQGVNGWLVEPEDVEALAGALRDAASSPSRLVEMGLRGRQIVEREFAWPVLAERQIQLYEELLGRR